MLVLLFAMLLSPTVPPPSDRAAQNWAAVNNGSRSLSDLSPAELQELILLDSSLRRPRILPSDTRAACLDREQSRAPSELEAAVADLKCSQRR